MRFIFQFFIIIKTMEEEDIISNGILDIDIESDADLNSSISIQEQEQIPEKKESNEVVEHVIKYINIDNLIKKLEKEIHELKSQKKPKEELILDYLIKKKKDQIVVSDGKLLKNKAETKAALTVDMIRTALTEKINDVKVVDSLIQRMDELRPKNTKVNLKRTVEVENKKKKK